MAPETIYLASVLLEPNRWTPGKIPGLRLSPWLDRIAEAGFDGVELWENHALLADDTEKDALIQATLSFPIFNSYVNLRSDGRDAREKVAAMARALGARAIKFNFSHDAAKRGEELSELNQWAQSLSGIKLLCECHPGTSVEEPEQAAAALASCPEVGIVVHPLNTPQLEAWLSLFGKRVCHSHIQWMVTEGRFKPLSQCRELLEERLQILRRHRYQGSYTIEFTGGVAEAPEDPGQLFQTAVHDLACLRETLGRIN